MAKNDDLNVKTAVRPFGFVTFIIVTLAITFVTTYLLVIQKTTLSEASPIFIALMAAWSPIITFYVHGRSKEKLEGKADDQFIGE